MDVSELWQQAALGALGGLSAELLHWYLLARKPEGIRAYRTGILYWVTTIGMIALGGLMPVLYLDGRTSAVLCFHLGAATPLLLQKLVSAIPSTSTGVTSHAEPQVSLRTFINW